MPASPRPTLHVGLGSLEDVILDLGVKGWPGAEEQSWFLRTELEHS